MSQCFFSRQAKADLAEIKAYIARDSRAAADRLVKALERRSRRLADFPEMGEKCDQLLPGLRVFSAAGYAIFYRIEGDSIEIARVVSGARDIKALFEGES